jgi:hypothetical protein
MRAITLALAAMALTPSAVVWAHHSYAAVDMTKRATVQGTVTTLEWTNPHVWLWISVPDGKGTAGPFAFEALSPSELTRFFGWSKHVLTPGQPVTVEFAPFRNGDHGGALTTVSLADGRVLRGRQTPPNLEPKEAR